MPKKKCSLIEVTHVQTTQEEMGRSVLEVSQMCTEKNLSELDLNLLEMEIEERYNNLMKEKELMLEYELSNLDLKFNAFLCSISENILNAPIEMRDEILRYIVSDTTEDEGLTSKQNVNAPVNVRRGRSRSARNTNVIQFEFKKLDGRSRRKRSVSLDMSKTPINKVCLSHLTSAKKYTVSKTASKVEDTGISVRRVMKPDEEAISTRGSPLFVHPTATVPNAPTVHIPLPGGVVINVEPKTPKRDCAVPELDETTKKQLKLICDQLTNLFEM